MSVFREMQILGLVDLDRWSQKHNNVTNPEGI